jgi:uncharacterized membrane protein YkoI
MKRGKTVAIAASALLISLAASAGDQPCSIHATKSASKSELTAMAKWTEADAREAALKSLSTTPEKATVKKSELEVEDGCLVYSFDIEVAGDSKGHHEIEVDAGNGRILSTDHDRH